MENLFPLANGTEMILSDSGKTTANDVKNKFGKTKLFSKFVLIKLVNYVSSRSKHETS